MTGIPVALALAPRLAVDLAADGAPAPEEVTPGIGGFLVFFLLGLASWLLYRSFTTHMRRVDVRARRLQDEAAAERARRSGRPGDDPAPAGDGREGTRETDDGASRGPGGDR